MVRTVANNPAGRLKDLFEIFHQHNGGKQLGDWWNVVASEVAEEGAAYSVRAEAGALLRDVEQAARALPAEDNPESHLAERPVWARPIFGWGLHYAPNQPITAEDLIPRHAINALNGLASVLRRDAAEFEIVMDATTMDAELANVHSRLQELLQAIIEAQDFPERSRRGVTQSLVRALDDLTYVRIRGLSHLHRDVQSARVECDIATENADVEADPERLAQVKQWSAALLEVVNTIERIVVPTATIVAVAVTTGDIPAALLAGTASRAALEAGSSSAQRQLPAGSSGTDGPAEPSDQ